jgi:glycosyltransferase involved in cell wall biosynthesis
MKVAIVTAYPRDINSPKGGVEAVSVVLVEALARAGAQLDVITLDSVSETEVSSQNGVRVHRLPRRGASMLTGAIGADRRNVTDYVLKLRPDLVHAHDTYGLMVADLTLPRVFTVHGFIYRDTLLSQQKFAWLRSKIWERVEKAGWAKQPHIISISPYVRERLNGVRGVIHDIDNPISRGYFESTYTPQPGRIFSAAVINPRKNPLNLVRAFAQLAKDFPSAELRLAGPVTNEAYGEKLKQEISKAGLQDRVQLLGRVSAGQVRSELQSASVFALVSLEENSPLGVEEAMAMGVPVVTSNRCGMPYMVRHGESGFLVDPLDVSDIARRLRQLLLDKVLHQKMSVRAKQVARDRFHPDVVAARTLEVYRDAIGTRAQGASA